MFARRKRLIQDLLTEIEGLENTVNDYRHKANRYENDAYTYAEELTTIPADDPLWVETNIKLEDAQQNAKYYDELQRELHDVLEAKRAELSKYSK